jgi:PTS system nitrogen regulatory IIA component
MSFGVNEFFHNLNKEDGLVPRAVLAMTLADLLTVERVVPRLCARDRQDALRKLAPHISNDAHVAKRDVKDALMRSVEFTTFGPGSGVSLPHAVIPGLAAPFTVFARLDPALDFGAADGSLTDLMVLLVSPSENGAGHLRALACIARRLREQKVREQLRACNSRDCIYSVLIGYDGASVSATTAQRLRSFS